MENTTPEDIERIHAKNIRKFKAQHQRKYCEVCGNTRVCIDRNGNSVCDDHRGYLLDKPIYDWRTGELIKQD